MTGELDDDAVAEFFRGKNVLITGSTGFLGKGNREGDLWNFKRKTWAWLQKFYPRKVTPLPGDIIYKNLGLGNAQLTELSKEIDIIINGAATTNFFERYDVAFDSNVLGAKHICKFAKNCPNLKMLLHVSTAYVSGELEGLQLEKPFQMGETLKGGTNLDIEFELKLIRDTRMELKDNCSSEMAEKKTMKELGLKRAREFGWPNTYVFTKAMGEMLLGQLRGELPVVIIRPSIITRILKEPLPGWTEGVRTIDSVIIAYAKQALSFFLVDLDSVMDVIPGDMVVNAMMVAMAAHSEEQAQTIYHLTSSLRNPVNYCLLADSGLRYFLHNPPSSRKNGAPVRLSRMRFFSSIPRIRTYMAVKYKLPIEILHLVNIALCGVFSRHYMELKRKYNYFMHLIELYAPYTMYKGCFDDLNTERLRERMKNKEQDKNEGCDFCFDPKLIDWGDYFYRIHIPGVIKYLTD